MTPEQKQLERIQEHQKRRSYALFQNGRSPMSDDTYAETDFLLSLVKSQEAPIAIETLKDLHDSDCLYVTHNGACDCAEGVVVNRAAASMRSACVEKVQKIGDEVLAEFAAEFKPDGRSFSVLKREAVIKFLRKLKPALESLSIEKPKE